MEEERISMEEDDLAAQQTQGDDSVFIDVPADSSVDNIPAHDYSDDNIDDIGVVLTPSRVEGNGDVDNPQGPLHDTTANTAASAAAGAESADVVKADAVGHLQATPEPAAAVAEGGGEEEEEKKKKAGEEDRTDSGEAAAVVVAAVPERKEEKEEEVVVVEEEEGEGGGQEDTAPRTSTPKAKGGKSPGKTLKEKLGQIPARLSKLSIFNALRSGTYVVNEPPPPPPSADDNNDNDDNKEGAHDADAEDNNDNEAVDNNAEGATVADKDTDNKETDDKGGVSPDDKGGVSPDDKGGVSPKKKARTMTDNGVVASEDNPQVAMTKMPEETLPPEEQGEGLPVMPQHPVTTTRKPHSVHRSALTKLLCGLYALMLVVFGVVFAIANSLTVKERQHLYYLEVFLLYLYLGSLATLLYFQICILRGKQVRNAYLDNSIRVIIRRSQDNLQLSPCPSRKDNPPPLAPNTPDKDFEERDVGLEPRKEPLDQMSTLSNASDFRSHLVLPPDGQVAHVGEGINFYLRLGALAFSIGSVTLDGFHIASYFETENTTTCESHIFILVYIAHLIFTFVQTFFLFKNHKLVIDKNKASVRFGLMHLLATNLCVWFVTAVTETAEDYRQQDFLDNRNESNPPALKSCYEDMTLARTASPYLFPCTIIYSIIAAGIVYRMYTYVGIKVKQRWPSHTSLTSSAAPQGVVSMDCEKANKGLFSGLLIAVVTLIAIATFFVFDSRLNNPVTATKVFFVMEISLLMLTGGCIVVGNLRFQKLRFLENYLSLDSVLLLVSLAGAYIYLCFMLISSASMLEEYGVVSVLSLVTIAVGLVQSTLQAIFILDGLCRRAENDVQVENKPGRAVVTFVLVCNLALWVVTLFEIRKTIVVPFHRSFYGILPWNIILHLCVPLYIYFRFHSAICLSKIWFNAYQKGDKYA